jgi:hypothetical protein
MKRYRQRANHRRLPTSRTPWEVEKEEGPLMARLIAVFFVVQLSGVAVEKLLSMTQVVVGFAEVQFSGMMEKLSLMTQVVVGFVELQLSGVMEKISSMA